MGRGQPGLGYRPALDGVRALAVTAVVLFHGGVSALSGGFLGVDAFFVLSGFLITSLLLAEHERTGRVRLAAFWGRRARRLLPALLVVLVAVAWLGQALLPPVEVRLLRGDALAALIYVANWRMIYRGDDYFAQTAAPSPLQHTWSLGIEEQFYLLWPLLVIGALVLLGAWIARRRPTGHATRQVRLGLLVACLVGTAASAITAAVLYRRTDINRDYFGTDTRAQALLIGCALALALSLWPVRAPAREGPDPTRDEHGTRGRGIRGRGIRGRGTRHWLLGGLATLGAAGTLALWLGATGTSPWLYRAAGLTGCALAVAAVIAHAVISPTSPTARLLALAPLVWLGRISYGVYLWHWPLFTFATAERTGLAGPPLLVVRIALALTVATLSFILIEQPIRHGTGWWRRLVAPARPRWLTRVGRLLVRRPVRAHLPPMAGLAEHPARGIASVPGTRHPIAPTPASPTQAALGGQRTRRTGIRAPGQAGRRAAPGPVLPVLVAMLAVGATGAAVLAATRPSTPNTPTAINISVPHAAGAAPGAHPAAVPPMRRAGRSAGSLPRVDIFGDSVAWTIGAYLPDHPGIEVHNHAIEGCGITVLPDIQELGTPHRIYPYCPSWPGRWSAGVNADDPDVSVILLNRWELMDAKLNGAYHHVGEPVFDRYLTKQLDQAIGIAGSRGARVVLLSAAYTHRSERPDGGLYDEDQPARVDAWNALLRKEVSAHHGTLTLLDLNRLVCPDGHFTWVVNNVRVRSDGLHFTPAGVQEIIAPWLLPKAAAIAATGSP